MTSFTTPTEIKNIFDEFWDKSYDEIFTTMAGLADIWEGPVSGNRIQMDGGTGTIIGIQIYNDKIFIVQGGGLSTYIKVISPNGVEIYDLGSNLCLMTHTAMDVYGGMTVINDEELIVGYMYINLKLLFMAPYGIDLSTLWNNPVVKITPIRISSTSWVVAIRDSINWRVFSVQKESPEDCLPCKKKKAHSSKNAEFECKEENYSRQAMRISGYRANRSALATGVGMSVCGMDGFGKMEKIPVPIPNNELCLEAIDEYTSLFNKQKISPTDIGMIGQKMSSNCSRVLYLNMLQIVEYKVQTKHQYEEYTTAFLKGEENNSQLVDDSEAIMSLISPLLVELKNTKRDSSLFKSIFKEQVWWAPIWFAFNRDKIVKDSRINAYTQASFVKYDDFVDVLMLASNAIEPEETAPLPMGWIIMAEKGDTPIRHGKHSMTYFRFPFALCMSTRTIFSVDNREFKAVCDVETRADGIYVWVWDDKSTLWYKQSPVLKCYKTSNSGVTKIIATHEVGYTMSPVDNKAQSVGISPNNDYWIVRDYYLKDSQSGEIGWVESKVAISADMKELYDSGAVSPYANINEISGIEGGAKGTMHYKDGGLESHWQRLDLDDNSVTQLAWGNDGPQYDFMSGYTGYQIAVSGEL